MDVRSRELAALAARQYDVVAAWQLLEAGWSRDSIRHRARRHSWTALHPGVYLLGHARPTVLGHASAAARWGFREHSAAFETVIRPGSGGPRRIGSLLVSRSLLLAGDVASVGGIPATTPERTLIDLAATLDLAATARSLREAVRLRKLTIATLVTRLHRHRGRRGTRALWDLADRYSSLPYSQTRSNAEARALELLHEADVLPDRVNAVIAGEEADLVWSDRGLIVEIDGRQFHLFRDEDERKQRCWEAAGYTVRRLDSQAVYDDPGALIDLVAQETRASQP
jgi:very-short-patch-repair endonuclease